jgi:hypothetical protein
MADSTIGDVLIHYVKNYYEDLKGGGGAKVENEKDKAESNFSSV